MTAWDLLWIVPLVLFLLVLKGFFSGSEIALVNADRIQLLHRAKQGERGAALVIELLKHPERLLTTTLVGTNIATVALTTLGTILMIHLAGDDLGDLYAFVIFTPLLLIFGEIVPKSVYQEKSTEIAPVAVYALRFFSWVLAPIVVVFAAIARLAARLAGVGGVTPHLFVTRDQLRSVMQLAERAGGPQVLDRMGIERAIRFSDTTVGEVMIPIAEMIAVDQKMPTERLLALVRRRGAFRLPVYADNVSNIVGIVSVSPWDVLERDLSAEPLGDLIAPAHYTSAYETLAEILPILRSREDRMAVVVDEFGSAIGLITEQDVFEEVVGDIASGQAFDEGSAPRRERSFEVLGEDVYLMESRLPISELNDILGVEIAAREFHTVGGLVQARLRHLAHEGESVVEAGYRFTVVEAGDRSIRKVRVERALYSGPGTPEA